MSPLPGGRRRHRFRRVDERGAVAGLEGLLFSTLIVLGGLVLIIDAWSVIDSRTTLNAAAREYLRSYTNSDDAASGRAQAERMARLVVTERGARSEGLSFTLESPNGFGPCAPVTVVVSTRVPSLRAPFIADFAPVTVTSKLSGVVRAHRRMTPDSGYDPSRTVCFGD